MKTLLIVTLLCVTRFAHASFVTNIVMTSITNQRVTKVITLQGQQTAKIVNFGGQVGANCQVTEIIDGIRVEHGNVTLNATYYGPSSIEFALPSGLAENGYTALITVELSAPPAGSVPIVNIPSNAVVIPADSAGPVTILLESSADLVTWNSASPGTYGTSSTNRFFRVRAVRATTP